MFQIFHSVNIDWLGKRRFFIGISILLMLAGMGTALYRHKFHPNGTDAFNLGVDFKGAAVAEQERPADRPDVRVEGGLEGDLRSDPGRIAG